MNSKIKLGLSAVVILTAIGLPSPLIAMGSTALCSVDVVGGEACPEKFIITHVHESTLSGAKAKILTSIISAECDVLFLGDTVWKLATPLWIEGKFTYTSCGSCTVEQVGFESLVTVSKVGHETASISYTGEIHVSCSGLNCYYEFSLVNGTVRGPLLSFESNGEVYILGQTLTKVKGIFCPWTSSLDIGTTPLSQTDITT